MLVHKEKKPFECKVCSIKFCQKSKLKSHISTVHEGKRPYECSICNGKFKHKGHLNAHNASIHERKVQYNISCSNFKDESKLNKHQSIKEISPLNAAFRISHLWDFSKLLAFSQH